MQDTLRSLRDSTSSAMTRIASAAVTRMHPLIQLRWIAVTGQIATIVFVHFFLDIALPLQSMAVVLACLIGFNLFSMWRWRDREEVTNESLFFAMLVDVFTFSAQLHLSGGAANPFVFLYLLQVVLAAVLLQPWASWTIAGITGGCFVAQMLWAGPVVIPDDYRAQGLLVCFLLNAALVVVFINRISRILRAHDEHLAAMRQRAAEEEHIVRMGLLASGAAHELGTPLATISVLLGDWRRMPMFREQTVLVQESEEMQIQLDRCKSIVSGILLSAGEMRAESLEQTSIGTFLDNLVSNWCATRPVKDFNYIKTFTEDATIVSDEGLKQMICNVLDNALEASPGWVSLEVMRDDDDLIIRVLDEGPGFALAMLAQFGRPYQSSKGRPGSGLGLFLSVNVARALGGNIFAQNRDPRGAVVTMVLPLAALAIEEEAADD
jgi:two-component system sensor histidine kinase RegB